jgi:hypothetical protein
MKKISSYWQSPAIPVQIFTPAPLVPLALHVQQSAIQNSSNDLTNTVDELSLQLCSKTKVNFEWLKYNSEVLLNTKQTKMNQKGIIPKKNISCSRTTIKQEFQLRAYMDSLDRSHS